jgi:hypothetical protein
MSRARIACAAAAVLAGFVGAFAVVKLATPDDAPASAASIRVMPSRSACDVDRGAGVVAFRVTLRNGSRQDRSAQLEPWLRFSDGDRSAAPVPALKVSLLAIEVREYSFAVPYTPRLGAPTRCSVSLDAGGETAIPLQRAS